MPPTDVPPTPRRRTRRRLTALLAAAGAAGALGLAAPGAALAGDEQRAVRVGPAGKSSGPVNAINPMAQTFVAEASGRLTRIELPLSDDTDGSPLHVSILPVDAAGRPATPPAELSGPPAEALATATVAPADVRDGRFTVVPAYFTDGPVLAAGTRYAVLLTSAVDLNHAWGVRLTGATAYPDGAAFLTWVRTPDDSGPVEPLWSDWLPGDLVMTAFVRGGTRPRA